MVTIAIADAAKRLDELVDDSQTGEEVLLTRANRPVAKIVALPVARPRPRRGSDRDFIASIAPEFDATP